MLVDVEEVIISFLTVLSPILKKRMQKMITTLMEVTPPVIDLYSASLLYLRSLLVWKKSKVLKTAVHDLRQGMIEYRGIFKYVGRKEVKSSYSYS